MRRVTFVLLLLGACGGGANGGDDDGQAGPAVEIATDFLDQTLGDPIGLVFTDSTVLHGPFSCFAPASDGTLLKAEAVASGAQVAKIAPNSASPMWTTSLTVTSPSYPVGCTLLAAPDGGAVFVSNLSDGDGGSIVLIGVTSAGVQRWEQVLTKAGFGFIVESAALSSGNVVVTVPMPAPNMPVSQYPLMLVGLDALDGHQVFSTELPDVVVHGVGDGVTIGIANSGNNPPGQADAVISQIVATADGGFAVVGGWLFGEEIECGTELDPQVPSSRSCSFINEDVMAARFDASGALRWKVRIGAPYATPTVDVRTVAELPDGSIMGGGMVSAGIADDPTERGLAFLIDPSGDVKWAKAYVWNMAPGESFLSGGTALIASVPTAAGVRFAIHPPDRANTSCPIVELDSSGTLVRAQTVGFPQCAGIGVGADLYLSGVNAVSKVMQ